MVVGMVVLSTAARVQLVDEGDCFVDEANWKLGLLMYVFVAVHNTCSHGRQSKRWKRTHVGYSVRHA